MNGPLSDKTLSSGSRTLGNLDWFTIWPSVERPPKVFDINMISPLNLRCVLTTKNHALWFHYFIIRNPRWSSAEKVLNQSLFFDEQYASSFFLRLSDRTSLMTENIEIGRLVLLTWKTCCLFVSRVLWRWYAGCLINLSIFAEFPMVVLLLRFTNI